MRVFFVRLDSALALLYRVSGYTAAMCLIAIGLLVAANIVSRMLSMYIPGLTEYSGYAMAASSFLALAYTFENKGHIRVELIISRLSTARRWYAEFWCLSVAVITTIYLAVYITKLVYLSWKFEEYSEGADAILLWKPQALAMVGSIILAICVLHNFIRFLHERFGRNP